MDSKSEKDLTLPVQNLVIVGSGPAGYTAAIYAARANLSPLLITGFEKGGIAGGQLMSTTYVENFPGFPNGILGPELMDLMKSQAERWGTKLVEEDVDSIDFSTRPFSINVNVDSIKTNSLIIATGARANKLGLPKENQFWSKGISACAICDGATPQFKKEQLAIVGGGDSACEEAVYLTKYGSHVHLIVRSNSLKASAAMASRVLANSMITVHWQKEVVDVEGSEWLERLIIKKVKTGEQSFLDVRGLFYAIGHTPNTDFLQGQLDLTSLGYLSTKAGRPETSIAGVFAAGDVADSEWRQGITAAGSGCQAALAAEKWLSEKNLSQLIERDQLEPSEIKEESNNYVTKESEYKENAIWQKGNYVLRRLYHESNRPLLVIYTSKSCGPCHVLKPQLKRILKEFEGKVQGVEIDIEDDQDIAIQAGVNGTPLVQLFKSKVLQAQWKGVKPKSQFKNEIINLLSNDSE